MGNKILSTKVIEKMLFSMSCVAKLISTEIGIRGKNIHIIPLVAAMTLIIVMIGVSVAYEYTSIQPPESPVRTDTELAADNGNNGLLGEPLDVSFSWNVPSEDDPLTVYFTDTSKGGTMVWYWEFGDGSTSSDQNPTHTYASAGRYRVSLEAHNDSDGQGAGAYVTVTEAKSTFEPSFTWNVPSKNDPLTVQFTDTSTGNIISWYWDFGDGAYSYDQNPIHTYASAGTFTVTLEAHDEADGKGAVNSVTVTGATPKPTQKPAASFYSPEAEAMLSGKSDHGIYNNDVVSFIDTSTGSPASWLWDFGDGRTSTLQNPTHVYGEMGGYTVTLTVKNAAGSSTISKEGYVPVGVGIAASSAHFSADKTSGSAPFTVTFHDDDGNGPSGVGPIWREWHFGDGTVVNYQVDNNASATPYALHTYEKPGTYTVMLYMDNRLGHSILTKHHYITVTEPVNKPVKPIAAFKVDKIPNYPLQVSFTDMSTGAPTAWLWNFGDGSTSSEQNPKHTYFAPGTYTVTLTVSNINGWDSETQEIQVGEKPISVPPFADFSTNTINGYAPLTVLFTDLSQNAVARIWDFNGDGVPDSSDINPAYTYTVPGTYNVTLLVSNANGASSKTMTITVLEESHSGGSSNSGGSSHGGGSGGAGGSPEPQSNVKDKEISQIFITKGKPVRFDFPKCATPIVYVGLDPKKTAGKTTTIAEMLKGRSTLVIGQPSGEIYKFINLWVGNSGFATSKNIENPVVCFKVEKAWIKDKKIHRSSITLNRYCDKKWEKLSTDVSGEDEKYVYFTSKTSEFSYFAISGNTEATGATKEKPPEINPQDLNEQNNEGKKVNPEQASAQMQSPGNSKNDVKAPGFGAISVTIGLSAVFVCKRKKL
jgi:PGF-pre-PGF domain-containing protein